MDSITSQQNEPDQFAGESMKRLLAASQKQAQGPRSLPRFFFFRSEWTLLALLALIAFIPRLIFALKLDVYTDEPIYVTAGNWYVFLARQLNFTSSQWLYNNEHPAFAKLLMGISIHI